MKRRRQPGGNDPGGTCVCGRQATKRSHWCLPCRVSLKRWLLMSPAERKASYGRAEQRWCRVNTFGQREKIVPFKRRAS